MEKRGSFKVRRYYPGDEVAFRIAGDDTWYAEEILDVLVDDDLVLFANRVVPVEKITHIRSFKMQRWSKPFGRQLYNFSIGWIVYSLGATLFGNPLTTSVILVPAVASATGFLLQKLFRKRTFKIDGRRRLRVLDLSFKKGLVPMP